MKMYYGCLYILDKIWPTQLQTDAAAVDVAFLLKLK